MSMLAEIGLFLIIALLYWVGMKIHERYFTEETPSTQLFCPAVEERTPLAEDYKQNVVWRDERSAYGYDCEVCGYVHVFDFGIAPAPIYVGDKIRFRFPSDGVVQAPLDAD